MNALNFARCPECQTTFRVTSQQLALRDGQVRCGRCRTVFNAYGALVDPKGLRIPGPGMASVETDTMTLRDFVAVKEESDIAASKTASEKPTEKVGKKRIEKRNEQETSEKITLVLVENAVNGSSQISRQTTPFVLSASDAAGAVSQPGGAATRPNKKRRRRDDPTPMALVLDSGTPDLWQKLGLPKWMPPIFYGLSLSILAIGLWAQTVFYFHDLLAYRYPEARSFLAASCGLLNCRIEPYRDLDALVIESSELHSFPEQPQRLALTATIRNRGKQPITYPLLQFELTDTQDKVSGRRYFAPEVYMDNTSRIVQGLGGNRDATFTLQLESHLDTASGYRLSLVYSAS